MGKVPRELPLDRIVGELVPRSSRLAIGGLHFHNTPMAMVRELIRQQVRIAVLIPPIDGSINADQLIGAGLVDEVVVAFIGLEIFGLANRFRAAAEQATIRIRDMEEAGFAMAMAAGAAGQPFAVLPEGFLPRTTSPPGVASVNGFDYCEIKDPFTGRTHTAARALTADVAIVHCQYVDRHGNGGFAGATFLDLEVARIAGTCLLQAEERVEALPPSCRDIIPAHIVDAFAIVPGGAHPGSSHGFYQHDGEHIQRYAEASRTDAGFARYRREIIGRSEEAYRNAANVAQRIAELGRPPP